MGAGYGQNREDFILASGRRRNRLQSGQTRPAIPRLPYLHAIQPAAGVTRRRSAWQRIQRRARHRRIVVIAGSSRSNTPSGAATRRQILGYRACYVARGAKRSGLSVPPAHDSECETRSGPCHAPQRLGGCRSRLARQGNQSAPAWLEPASPYYSVAPQTGARRRNQRPKRPRPIVAKLWRRRSGQGTVGIRCAGDLAEARNPKPDEPEPKRL